MKRFVTIAWMLTLALPALAAAGLPPAAEILDRYVEVTGGRAAYEKITARTSHGTFTMQAMNLQATMTTYQAAPGFMRMETELPQMGKIEAGCDGTIAWEVNPMTGARLLDGTEKVMTIRDAVFNADLRWRDLYPKAETTGREQIDNRDMYVVVLTPKEGPPETRYYGVEDGLLWRVKRTMPTQMGDVPAQSTFADYRTFDGIMLATTVRNSVSVQEFTITTTSVDHAPLAAATFAPPAAVAALIAPAAGK
jgi:outer membrane lipoprotein-sorting protein